MFGDDGFSFGDVVDTINPLHHIPVVGTLYRDLSQDEIANGPRILGGGLIGGVLGSGLGLLGSVANVVVKELSGKDVGEHVLSWFKDEDVTDPGSINTGETGEKGDKSENGLPEYLEIARATDPPGAVRAREEVRVAREAEAPNPRQAELERAIVAYRAQSQADPWVRLADRTR